MATSSPYINRKPQVFINKFSVEEKNNIKNLYKEGKVLTEIGNKYNVSFWAVRNFLKREGIDIIQNNIRSRKYSLNEEYFNMIDTEEKAYFLGLLYADGNVNFRTISLSLQEQDRDILEKLKLCLNSSKDLYFINKKGTSSNQYSLVFTSERIVNDLSKLGCIENKTFKLQFPTDQQVPSYLINHFIRGYFDGDGCISVNLNKNNKAKFSIVGKEDFLLKLQSVLIEKLQISKTKLYKKDNVHYLDYTGIRQCSIIRDYLYEGATIFLDRKYKKFNLF